MKYIGIDLGTTNSAICSLDGEEVRLYKSPDQHDVTPSAIYFDSRGRKFYGARAYRNAAREPDRVAKDFKRVMGTSTPIKLAAANITMTPEECSAEILRLLFNYLPEELRNGGDTGTVIAVPAAFNQMQKDSTMSAAEAASLGRVALMQEPIAAVQSAMRKRKNDGVFAIYDLGGGTLDIAIAQNIAGRVNILAGGGIAMCGGRDFDRALLESIVMPWLLDTFDLPEDLTSSPDYRPLLRMAMWAAELAKIELSQKTETNIALTEADLRIKDQAGTEIYLDIPINRTRFDELMTVKVEESIQKMRETLAKAQLTPGDVERIVFVGGPTSYKPLRDKVASELGIAPSTDVNPMTAVAEGAAIYAESIDWSSKSRVRKSSKATVSVTDELGLSFNYLARTADSKSKIAVKLARACDGMEFQIDSPETGWSSGRIKLVDGVAIDLQLAAPGENAFKVFVFSADGLPVSLVESRIVIARTAASVDAIASHSVGVEARERLDGPIILEYLVREGDQLPKKGKKVFRSEESLSAGSSDSIRFRIREGEIADPITGNQFIGMFEIKGTDFDSGTIPAGTELICQFEFLDSGCLRMEVEIPHIGCSFRAHNFYSRKEGLIDYSQASYLIAAQSEKVESRLNEIEGMVDDPRLDQAREKLEQAQSVNSGESEPDVAKQALDRVQEATELIAMARKDHLKEIRQIDFDKVVNYFVKTVRQHARPTEIAAFESLSKTAQRVIADSGSNFESHLAELRGRNYEIMWRQDWFVIERFKWLSKSTYLFPNAHEHGDLVEDGKEALGGADIERLRTIVTKLNRLRYESPDEDDLFATTNIVRS